MLCIAYQDELGYVLEDLEIETIEFFEGFAYLEDKKISINDLVRIGIKESEM